MLIGNIYKNMIYKYLLQYNIKEERYGLIILANNYKYIYNLK
jgi:hypothetical protein